MSLVTLHLSMSALKGSKSDSGSSKRKRKANEANLLSSQNGSLIKFLKAPSPTSESVNSTSSVAHYSLAATAARSADCTDDDMLTISVEGCVVSVEEVDSPIVKKSITMKVKVTIKKQEPKSLHPWIQPNQSNQRSWCIEILDFG